MADLEEVKSIDAVITEQPAKLVEDLVEPIEEITSDVATVVSETIEVIAANLSLKMISESSLSEEQKKLASNIYDSVKKSIEGFINDPSVNNTVKITKTLGQVIKQLETTNVDGKVSTGADKKAVAIQLGRILIKEVIPDDKGEDDVLIVYDMIAEPTLEAMIEVSRVVNVAVQELAIKCCPSMLDFLKRVKSS
jgi:hypothetical protein